MLRDDGVLVGIETAPEPDEAGRRYYPASSHVAMLNDIVRTERFVEAIRSVVRPGDTVIDLGAGTGVLSLAAVKAGAEKVYAIEVSDDVRMIRKLCSQHVEVGTVEVIREWSTSAALPRKADVLVSEMIGNDPLDEEVLELTMDARRRLLKPEARLIPSRLQVAALPVEIPDEQLAQHRFTDATIAGWAERWGVEFRELADIDRERWQRFFLRPQETRAWQALAAPATLIDIDLAEVDSPTISATTTVEATAAGLFNGVVVYFEAELGHGVELSTHPAAASPSNHWCSPVWCVVDGRPVNPGDPITINYQRIGGRSELSCEST
jgi:16S rRNA G966 N2-methylase RsmD